MNPYTVTFTVYTDKTKGALHAALEVLGKVGEIHFRDGIHSVLPVEAGGKPVSAKHGDNLKLPENRQKGLAVRAESQKVKKAKVVELIVGFLTEHPQGFMDDLLKVMNKSGLKTRHGHEWEKKNIQKYLMAAREQMATYPKVKGGPATG